MTGELLIVVTCAGSTVYKAADMSILYQIPQYIRARGARWTLHKHRRSGHVFVSNAMK